MLFERTIQKMIEKSLFEGKIIVVYGARQVGKTTLLRNIEKKYSQKRSLFVSCDDPDVRAKLFNTTSTDLKNLFQGYELIFIDEAQRVKNIGLTLKIAIDNMPDKQFIVTGSSSFDLANKINEPLTGRKYEFFLYPLSVEEISVNLSPLEEERLLKNWLIYGMYPDVINNPGKPRFVLDNLVKGTLYKDALEHQNVKYAELLDKLLQALAFQVGQEVSYNELASLLGTNKVTVERYVKLLEQSFIIYQLKPFSRNLRNELKKMRKIYFYDVGVRNALIKAYGPIELRNDIGSLWENFLLSERIKKNNNHERYVNQYFWRTRQKQEIDFLEEKDGMLAAFEFKWQKDKFTIPKAFFDAYPNAKTELVNRKNYKKFVM
ncbi:MAG: hypothetical protein ACD_11C00118G0001 [uncultured bacterium]|nr:MAG: hypothetical protein ACD_11C00118G0001 [uncultured bacterium]HBR71593.1 ATPase [Candidatus Moranbacteria bacterium]